MKVDKYKPLAFNYRVNTGSYLTVLYIAINMAGD